ncbi:GvpL/GvpF family gas vesicle protein [Streptomyces sp. NPDC046712]|uniref:GvpL/GvpF family gas vesicle protein n=1 Tax=Streptomyces sp. NPDC046712 TaxID=3154802 RepID=UPI0033EF5B2F
MSTYVYGITRAEQQLPDGAEGIGEPPMPVRTVRSGDLVALVSDAPMELKPKRRDLLAHQRVVIGAAHGGPVLPLRFGGVSPDDDTVASILEEHHDLYLERLAALEGKDEFNVKASHHEEAVLSAVLADDPALMARHAANRAAGGGDHAAKLAFGELVARAVAEREKVDAALVRETLTPRAAGTRQGPEGTGWLANLSFLVERERRDEFLEAVRRLHEEHEHLQVQVTGPLPAYSFTVTD